MLRNGFHCSQHTDEAKVNTRYWETPQKFLKYFPFPILVLTGVPCPFRPYAWANSYSKDYLCTLFMLKESENLWKYFWCCCLNLMNTSSTEQEAAYECSVHFVYFPPAKLTWEREQGKRDNTADLKRRKLCIPTPSSNFVCFTYFFFFCKCKAYYLTWEQGQGCSLPSLMSK